MSDFIFILLGLNIICFGTVIFILVKSRNIYAQKKITEFTEDVNKKIKNLDTKVYFVVMDKVVSNISAEDLEIVRTKIKNDESHFGEFVIENYNDIIVLNSQTHKFEIEKIKEKYDESLYEQEKLKDREYYYYKEFIEKLTYVLNEINEFYREIKDITNLNIKFKLENIKDKVEFILEFFKEKGTMDIHKFKLYKIKNMTDLLKEEFDGKLNIEFKIESDINSYYIEIDKIYAEIKAVLYLVLKMKISDIDKSISLFIRVKDGYISFLIKNNTSNYSFLKLIDEDFMYVEQIKQQRWKFTVEDTFVEIEVPIRHFEGEQTDEIRTIVIGSQIDQIKDVIKLVLYDMNKFGFNNNEIYDMRLTLDELLVNAIEHGNKFDKTKKVHINYKFTYEGKKVAIEIEDEGAGFDINEIKEPDILSMRGRGISIIRKLVNEIVYSNNGRKVGITKVKEV